MPYDVPTDPNAYAPQPQASMPVNPNDPNGMMNPAMVDAILKMNMNKAGRDKAGMQMKMADQMRQDAQGQVQGKQVGRTFIAPNRLNALSSIGSSLMGAHMQGGAQADLDKMAGDETAGIQDWFKKYQQNAAQQARARMGMPGMAGEVPGQAPPIMTGV